MVNLIRRNPTILTGGRWSICSGAHWIFVPACPIKRQTHLVFIQGRNIKNISGNKLFKIIDDQININIPWQFSLFSDNIEVYGKTAISVVEIDKQINNINDKLLIEILRESYAKLYENVMCDQYLSYSLSIIQDFSLDSPVADRDLKAALEYMKNIRSLQ